MQSVDTIIIGNGISSKVLVHYLNKIGLTDILVIASDTFAPACSTRTTAINCLRGTCKGISNLGDLIVDSFHDFEQFYNEHNPKGICKTIEYQCWPEQSPNHDKWVKRFTTFETSDNFIFLKKELPQNLNYVASDAYIFSPELFFQDLDAKNDCDVLNDVIIDINSKKVTTQSGEKFTCKKLFICTSYMTSNFSHLVEDEKLKRQLDHSKPVAGTYLRYSKDQFDPSEICFEESFSFVIDEIHFIYRKQSTDILIGATTTNNQLNFLPDREGMLEQYQRLTKYTEGTITLPSFDDGELIAGIRHKGQKRTPFWGQINQDTYAIWGLYKNAFTMAFTAAKDITKLIQK